MTIWMIWELSFREDQFGFLEWVIYLKGIVKMLKFKKNTFFFLSDYLTKLIN